MFHSLKTILPKTLSQNKIALSIKATILCQKTDAIILTILGEELASEAKAVYVKDQVITIECVAPPIANELKLHESFILNKLQTEFPLDEIHWIQFIIRSI